MRTLLILAALALSACASHELTYEKSADSYATSKQTAYVSVYGDDNTSRKTADEYLMLKAAEETLRHGYAGFFFLSRKDRTSYSTAGIHLFERPGEEAEIRFITAEEIREIDYAHDASKIWNTLAPRYVKR